MFRTLRAPAFRNLWAGGMISTLGDMALVIALPFNDYNLTGSTLATGGTFMVQVLPRLVLGPVAGIAADRWDRKRLMVGIDLARAAALLPLFLVQSPERIWLVYVVGIAEATLSQFFGPAHATLLARIVADDQWVAANSLNSVGNATVRLVAPTLGGALLAFKGLPLVVMIDIASYVASAMLISAIALRPDQRRAQGVPAEAGGRAVRNPVRHWVNGLRLLGRDALLTRLVTTAAIAMLGQGVISVLLVPFVNEILGGTALEFGWLSTAQGLGGLAGGVIMGHVGMAGANTRVVSVSLGMVGVMFLLMVNYATLSAALILIALLGAPATAYTIAIQTLLQLHSEDAYRGRLVGIYGSVVTLALLIGMSAASLLGDIVPLVVLLNGAGAVFLVAGTFGLCVRVRPVPSVGEERSRRTFT